MSPLKWTNPSVKALAGSGDPFSIVRQKAQECALQAIENGWTGPPFEPLELAKALGIAVVPKADVREARLVVQDGRPLIEFDPNQPRERVRFSIAHEIGHTLFPDYATAPRNRSWESRGRGDEWQLEVLCNAAAAELLMPAHVFEHLAGTELDINSLLNAQRHFGVSMEALLGRSVELADSPAAAFVASQHERKGGEAVYRIDYIRKGRGWQLDLDAGSVLPANSCVTQCRAVGYTSTASEHWTDSGSELLVQCLGLPPYPGQTLPRVAGLVSPADQNPRISGLRLVVGDALAMHAASHGPRALVQVVNDKARRWGSGFARSVAERWPASQQSFVEWAHTPSHLRLGAVHVAQASSDLWIVSLVAQRGYGPSKRPRLSYDALGGALAELGDLAIENGWQIHMPRIGTGLSGGNWNVVRQLLESKLVSRGLDVVVYVAPATRESNRPVALQSSFELS